MGRIGNLGKLIIFETSDKKILNFRDFQRTISANWTNHEAIGRKPRSEFLNPLLQQISFTVTFNATHGVRPRRTMEAIERAVESGHVYPLVIGGAKVGRHQWKITQMSETWDVVMGGGQLQKATVSLTLEEYL